VKSASTRVYSKQTNRARPERRGVGRRSVIDEADAKVPVIDLANLLAGPGKMRRAGEEWVTNCVLDDHVDKSPSFCVNPEKNVWFCHGCLRGGDVVELARFAWGYEKVEVAMAASDLLHEFGHPIPERPESWHRRQERQKPVRDGIDAAKILVVRQRLYSRFFEPIVLATEDAEDRAHNAQLFWEATAPLARHLVSSMMEFQR
jgi:DNA primase